MDNRSLDELITEHVLKYKNNYYRLAYSFVKNADDALDIVQESIYKAIFAKKSLKNPEFIKTWFYRILVNTALDFIRKNKKVTIVDENIFMNYESGEDDNYENFDLKKALDSMPENLRTLIVLRYFEDLKIEEIAEILNENVNTIKTRLYKTLKMLRINMQDYEEA